MGKPVYMGNVLVDEKDASQRKTRLWINLILFKLIMKVFFSSYGKLRNRVKLVE